jgi:membrane protease YdiL (CAAX protease family)
MTATHTVRSRVRRAIIGPDGLRAGWGALIFIAIVTAIAMGLRAAMHGKLAFPPGEITPRTEILLEGIQAALVLVATAAMAWIEGKSIWAYGLRGPRATTHFLCGLFGGTAMLSLLIGVLHAGGYLVLDGVALHGLPSILAYSLAWLTGFTLTGISEEALYRGYLQTTLTRAIGFWPAAVSLSAIFAAGHLQNEGETISGVAQVFVAGLVFCLLLRASGSLWLGIGVHATWNWAQAFLWGTPESGLLMQGHLFASHAVGDPRISGGSVGPEGSWLAAPLMAAGAFALIGLMRAAKLLTATPVAITPT